jgi:hypothetical protein
MPLRLPMIGFVIALAGCHTTHVRVVDVETGEPVHRATVVAHASSWGKPSGGPGRMTTTRRGGRATFHAGPGEAIYGFDVSADGYVHWRTARNVIVSHDPGTREGSAVVLYLYQQPGPVALLTIPNNYRGPLLITRPKHVDPALSMQQRVHEFVVKDPAVPTVVPQSPPLHMLWTSQLQVRYADGRSLPNYPSWRRPRLDGVQVFQLEKYTEPQVLFVGEHEEFRAFRRRVNHPSGRFRHFDQDVLQRELDSAVQRSQPK